MFKTIFPISKNDETEIEGQLNKEITNLETIATPISSPFFEKVNKKVESCEFFHSRYFKKKPHDKIHSLNVARFRKETTNCFAIVVQ